MNRPTAAEQCLRDQVRAALANPHADPVQVGALTMRRADAATIEANLRADRAPERKSA